MLVVVDMLHTIAIIAVAFGAVAKLHIGIVGVGLAANGALVDIAFFLIGGLGGLFKVYRLGGMLVLKAPLAVAQGLGEIPPEEKQKVEDGDDG